MEINYKEFSTQLRNFQNSKDITHTLYSYDNFIEIIRKELGELRKEELDRALDSNTLKKEGVIIKDKAYLKEQMREMSRDLRDIVQRKNYRVREYQDNIDLLIKKLTDEFIGYSILTEAFEDPEISDIYCIKYNKIYVEKNGVNVKYRHSFYSEKHYNDFIERLTKEAGKELNKGDSKILDFDLYEDRYCAIEDVVAPNGKSLTIRKHGVSHVTLEQIIKYNCMDEQVASFLGTIIEGESNIVYAGITGSGKTTSLRALLDHYVTRLNKRMLVCEDTRELFPANDHTLELVTVKNEDVKIAVDLRQLVMTALRLKPKYICIGEVRGIEAESAVEAMSTGHSTLFTMHAGRPTDAIDRLVDKFLVAMPNISAEVAERKVSSSVDFVVIQDDIRGLGRRVTSITQVEYDSLNRRLVLKTIMKYNFVTNTFDFINKISEQKAETMMRRGVSLDKLYGYTDWESQMYKDYNLKKERNTIDNI